MLKPAKLFEIRLCGFQTVLYGTLGVPWSFSGDCVRCEGFLDRGVPGALNSQPSLLPFSLYLELSHLILVEERFLR